MTFGLCWHVVILTSQEQDGRAERDQLFEQQLNVVPPRIRQRKQPDFTTARVLGNSLEDGLRGLAVCSQIAVRLWCVCKPPSVGSKRRWPFSEDGTRSIGPDYLFIPLRHRPRLAPRLVPVSLTETDQKPVCRGCRDVRSAIEHGELGRDVALLVAYTDAGALLLRQKLWSPRRRAVDASMADDVTDYEKAAAGFAANTNLNKLSADIATQNDQLNKDIAGRKRATEKLVDQVAAEFADRSRVFFVDETPEPLYSDDDAPDLDEEDPDDVTGVGADEEAHSVGTALPDYDDEIEEEIGEEPEGPDERTAQWLVDAGPNTKVVLIMVKTGTDAEPLPVAGLKVYSHEAEDGVVHIAGHDVDWKKVGGFRYDAHRRAWAGAIEYLLFRLQSAVQEWMKTRVR